MKDSTRQKYMDAMNRRADLIQQADDAFSSGEVEKGKELTTSAAALNPEIEGYQALLAQEEKFAAPRPAPLDRETRERALWNPRQRNPFTCWRSRRWSFTTMTTGG